MRAGELEFAANCAVEHKFSPHITFFLVPTKPYLHFMLRNSSSESHHSPLVEVSAAACCRETSQRGEEGIALLIKYNLSNHRDWWIVGKGLLANAVAGQLILSVKSWHVSWTECVAMSSAEQNASCTCTR